MYGRTCVRVVLLVLWRGVVDGMARHIQDGGQDARGTVGVVISVSKFRKKPGLLRDSLLLASNDPDCPTGSNQQFVS